MGEARKRGTFKQRYATALERERERQREINERRLKESTRFAANMTVSALTVFATAALFNNYFGK